MSVGVVNCLADRDFKGLDNHSNEYVRVSRIPTFFRARRPRHVSLFMPTTPPLLGIRMLDGLRNSSNGSKTFAPRYSPINHRFCPGTIARMALPVPTYYRTSFACYQNLVNLKSPTMSKVLKRSYYAGLRCSRRITQIVEWCSMLTPSRISISIQNKT